MAVRVALLAEHSEAIGSLAASYEREWAHWYGPGRHGCAQTDLMQRTNRDTLPVGLVAFDKGEPVGTLALAGSAIRSHPLLTPTVIGLWVAPHLRRRGIASVLLRAAAGQARAMRYRHLYAASGSAAGLFVRRGWRLLAAADWDGEAIQVFALDL